MKELFKLFILAVIFLPGILLVIVDELLGLNLEIEKDLRDLNPGLVMFITAIWMIILLL